MSFGILLGSILLAIACPLVSGRSRILYPLVPNESLIAPSKYAKHPSHPLASEKSLIGPSKYATHRSHVIAHGRRLEAFHPPTTFKTFGDGIDPPPLGFGPLTLEKMAVAVTQSQTGINSTNIRFRSGFSDGPDTFAYVRQSHGGVPFANAVANVALHNNRIVSFGSSFVEAVPTQALVNITTSTPSLDAQSVIPHAENALNGKFNGHAPALEYLVQSDGSIALTHVVQIQNDSAGTWFEAFMDAHTGEILSITDFVAEASYKVVPIWQADLYDGQVTLVDPQDAYSSPMGWHNGGTRNTRSTAGNNVIAFDTDLATTNETRAGLVFDYTYANDWGPTTSRAQYEENIDAARTNAFYVINAMHDIAYKYGFTEESFNFQINNFGKGGLGDDPVEVGQSGICRISFYWANPGIPRDGAMDNSIIVHEFTHGITDRMTGGGTGSCLETLEAAGLAEGWSDAMAGWVRQKPIFPLPDHVIGRYVKNRATGNRLYPYSTSRITNPLRYSSIQIFDGVHVDEHGFSENARTDPTTPEGNVVFMHLFIDGLPRQPCNPTFVNARDALIQADQDRYAGVNKCLLWRVFASRGLGVNAANYVDDSSVPSDC
ncbi:Fungalysin metallopeptidase-domain-containing protein [Infundibulicybe gibba]|nr:Fungalysin metallopeptidase-domain-containing protein [Infundibulicybe gibba]